MGWSKFGGIDGFFPGRFCSSPTGILLCAPVQLGVFAEEHVAAELVLSERIA